MPARLLLSAWLLAFAPDATSSVWERAFAPDAVAAHLDRDGVALRIVPAGGQEADAPALALERALQGSPRVSRIERVSAVVDANEGELVARASTDGFDRLAIVRVFAIGSDERKQAVVTIYDGKGTAIAAFTAFAGEPMATAAATAGISDRTAQAAGTSTPTDTEVGTPGWQQRYDELFVGFDDVVGITSVTRGYYVAARSGVVAYRGKYREPLTGAAFYRYIGHDKLARDYERRRRKQIVLLASGGAVVLVSAIACIAMVVVGPDARDGGRGLTIAGGVIGGVGVVGGSALMGVGLIRPVHPVTSSQAQRLAESFNRDLRERLRSGAAVDVKLGLSPGREGAMLVARGSF